MNKIKRLPVEVVNLIRAGEVVERPANAVKELIENAIDAGSSNIKIELTNSGINQIIIQDNGIGMDKDDIKMSIEPHSTSKIESSNDLSIINSLGFRGEALPSIARISKMSIISSTNGSNGYEIDLVDGKIVKEMVKPTPKGTKIIINNLFYNVPARLKNLSSESIELSHITQLVDEYALSYPNIRFTYINNSKTLLSTLGDGNCENVITEIYGNITFKNLLKFESKNELYEISGFTSNNNIFRSNKNSISIFVNNRIIKNQSIIYAVNDAYKSIIPIGKYPITILNIKCSPELLDINVHPSKLEIKFTDESGLKSLITKTLRSAINEIHLVYSAKDTDLRETFKEIEKVSAPREPEIKINESLSTDDLWDSFDDAVPSNLVKELDTKDNDVSDEEEPTLLNEDENDDVSFEEETLLKKDEFKFSNLIFLGQFNRTYLLLESDDDNLYLIDQHAAMERVMYEKIVDALSKDYKERFELITPIRIDYSNKEVERILEAKDTFNDLGISLESFGGTTILYRMIPYWIPKGQEVSFLEEITNHVINHESARRIDMYDFIAKQMSCKKSIKASMRILPEEVSTLLASLDNCKMPYTCPHGRPTLVKISKYEIEKMFKRVI